MNISLFQNFTCTGEEELVSDCPANRDCISRCTTPYGIQCYGERSVLLLLKGTIMIDVIHFSEPTGECNQEEVRLANGDIAQEGRVEVCIDNVWGAVCGVEWNKIDALIICRQLGLGIGGMYTEEKAKKEENIKLRDRERKERERGGENKKRYNVYFMSIILIYLLYC